MTINEKLATIQTKFKSKKSRYNSFGKYNFRSAEDILEAIKPYLLDLGVSVTINEELIDNQDFPVMRSTSTISDGKESIKATALVGVDLQQKGMQMPQKFGSASSYGKKYSLGNLFLIDDTADSDATNSHGNNKKVSNEAPKLPWLNEGTKEFDGCRSAVKSGKYTVKDIRQKYSVSKKVESLLNN